MKRAVVEVIDRDGHARQTVPVNAWPVTIGRSPDCDVVLDDPYVAARHLALTDVDGAVQVTVGESVNGVECGPVRLGAGQSGRLGPGQTMLAGTTRLRVRRVTDALAPERPLLPPALAGRIPVPVLLAAVIGWAGVAHWLSLDPGARSLELVLLLVVVAVVMAAWAGLWALVSKVFRHQFEFWPHLRIAATYMLAGDLFSLALPLIAFSTGWVFFSRIAGLGSGAVLCAMLVAHVTRVIPARRRMVAGVAALLFVAGAAVQLSRNFQVHDRVFTELYVATLAPPAMRLVAPADPARFLEEARGLKAVLDARAKDEVDDRSGDFMIDGR